MNEKLFKSVDNIGAVSLCLLNEFIISHKTILKFKISKSIAWNGFLIFIKLLEKQLSEIVRRQAETENELTALSSSLHQIKWWAGLDDDSFVRNPINEIIMIKLMNYKDSIERD